LTLRASKRAGFPCPVFDGRAEEFSQSLWLRLVGRIFASLTYGSLFTAPGAELAGSVEVQLMAGQTLLCLL